MTGQPLLHRLQIGSGIVMPDEREQLVEFVRAGIGIGGLDGMRTGGQRFQFLRGGAHQPARPVPQVHEPLEEPQAKYLRGGVKPFTVGIAVRHREAIAPLPDAQHILRQADIPLDRCDGELGFLHFVLDNRLTP